MSPLVLRVATRSSDLALWQAQHVARLLRETTDGLEIEFVPMTTHADRHLDVPIAEIGGKGVFAKEVQQAVLAGRADLAVHSAKDLTAVTLDGLVLAAVPERGDARDALAGAALDDLAPGATLGTGSARRAMQLRAVRDDLEVVGLRGNIATRLARIGELDAIVVANVALTRLGLAERAAEIFDVDVIVPQVAQGALAVECRSADEATQTLLARIEHAPSRRRVDAERGFLERLGGDCDLPAGAHATWEGERLRLEGVLASDEHDVPVRRHLVREVTDPEDAAELGRALADELRAALGERGGSGG